MKYVAATDVLFMLSDNWFCCLLCSYENVFGFVLNNVQLVITSAITIAAAEI